MRAWLQTRWVEYCDLFRANRATAKKICQDTRRDCRLAFQPLGQLLRSQWATIRTQPWRDWPRGFRRFLQLLCLWVVTTIVLAILRMCYLPCDLLIPPLWISWLESPRQVSWWLLQSAVWNVVAGLKAIWGARFLGYDVWLVQLWPTLKPLVWGSTYPGVWYIICWLVWGVWGLVFVGFVLVVLAGRYFGVVLSTAPTFLASQLGWYLLLHYVFLCHVSLGLRFLGRGLWAVILFCWHLGGGVWGWLSQLWVGLPGALALLVLVILGCRWWGIGCGVWLRKFVWLDYAWVRISSFFCALYQFGVQGGRLVKKAAHFLWGVNWGPLCWVVRGPWMLVRFCWYIVWTCILREVLFGLPLRGLVLLGRFAAWYTFHYYRGGPLPAVDRWVARGARFKAWCWATRLGRFLTKVAWVWSCTPFAVIWQRVFVWYKALFELELRLMNPQAAYWRRTPREQNAQLRRYLLYRLFFFCVAFYFLGLSFCWGEGVSLRRTRWELLGFLTVNQLSPWQLWAYRGGLLWVILLCIFWWTWIKPDGTNHPDHDESDFRSRSRWKRRR